jgi:hypothetical protein
MATDPEHALEITIDAMNFGAAAGGKQIGVICVAVEFGRVKDDKSAVRRHI